MRKQSQNTQAKNEGTETALADYQNKVYKSVNAAAKAHNVPVWTLQARVKRHKSRAEINGMKQLLSVVEGDALVKWILEVSQNGYPLPLMSAGWVKLESQPGTDRLFPVSHRVQVTVLKKWTGSSIITVTLSIELI